MAIRRNKLLLAVAAALAATAWWQYRSLCLCSPSATGLPEREDSLTLLDSSKLTAVSPGYTYSHPLPEGARSIALDSLLLQPLSNRKWTAGGAPLAQAQLPLECAPAANHVAIHRLSVADEAGNIDRFTLIVVPEATAARFEQWVQQERTDSAWHGNLPPVYSSLLPGGVNPEPDRCRPRLWPALRKVHTQYHPGAAYEMRSAMQPEGSGHQAMYDAQGKLIRQGLGAGSADRASPRPWNLFHLKAHRDRDVIPFVWAAQLDGNPVNPKLFYRDFDAPLLRQGDHLAAYMAVRPAFHASRPELAPGVCAPER